MSDHKLHTIGEGRGTDLSAYCCLELSRVASNGMDLIKVKMKHGFPLKLEKQAIALGSSTWRVNMRPLPQRIPL